MDILKSDLIRCPYKTASLLSHQYFNTLRSLLDKHTPIVKKNIPRHAETGFMVTSLRQNDSRKYERAWHHENSASNRSRYRAAINHYNFLLEKSKCNHYSNIVAENQGNPKALWNCFKKILHSPSSPSKSCDLDLIPTSLVKECADILTTPITKIVNYSITEGSFPNCFKMAYVTPLQKKPSLDRNIHKNYRLVSNLSFISKLIEKVVAKQLNEFISLEGLLNVNQSAYKSSHSTETALLKIQNDIALSVDSRKAVALTLLDLSAAFDTIDHSLLYDCLHDWFGLDGTVLSWIKSYLSNRKQKIKIGDSFSEAVILPFGVPQGSVLGPLLFTLYTSPLSQVISKFKVTHHLYADDTQIYLAVDSRNFDSSREELTECLKSVQEWMDGVKLKLNPEKNEFIIIGQKAIRELLAPNFPVPLLQNNISPSVEVKNLGVIFDSDNSFDNHVAKVCRACYYHLRDLR